jgi:hypothetical protein
MNIFAWAMFVPVRIPVAKVTPFLYSLCAKTEFCRRLAKSPRAFGGVAAIALNPISETVDDDLMDKEAAAGPDVVQLNVFPLATKAVLEYAPDEKLGFNPTLNGFKFVFP